MDVFPLPRIDDTLDLLAQAQFLTTLDLVSVFWQVQMHDELQEKTAFATQSGLYEFKMPLGLWNLLSVAYGECAGRTRAEDNVLSTLMIY